MSDPPSTGRFKPGQGSANPGGKQRVDPETRKAFTECSLKALTVLKTIMEKKDAEDRDRIAAARAILEYGMPRPAPERDKDDDAAALRALAEVLAMVPAKPAPIEDDDEET